MKHIKKYEKIVNNKTIRKVYWVSTFEDNFEKSLVKLVIQYNGREDDRISIIDYALGLASDARKHIKKSEFVLVTMEFYVIDDENNINETFTKPDFDIYDIKDKIVLENSDFTFVGFAPYTDMEKYKIYKDSKKYNL